MRVSRNHAHSEACVQNSDEFHVGYPFDDSVSTVQVECWMKKSLMRILESGNRATSQKDNHFLQKILIIDETLFDEISVDEMSVNDQCCRRIIFNSLSCRIDLYEKDKRFQMRLLITEPSERSFFYPFGFIANMISVSSLVFVQVGLLVVTSSHSLIHWLQQRWTGWMK